MVLRGGVVLAVALLAAAVAAVSQVSASAPQTAATSTRDAAACRALGFDADTLDCRRCDELAAFLHEKRSATESSVEQTQTAAAIDADCRVCCSDLSALHLAGGSAQYARVVLEVCTCKFGRYPKVANFVQHHAAKHDKLEIKVPTLVLSLSLFLVSFLLLPCALLLTRSRHVDCIHPQYINARHPFLLFYDADGTKQEEVRYDTRVISLSLCIRSRARSCEKKGVLTAVTISASLSRCNTQHRWVGRRHDLRVHCRQGRAECLRHIRRTRERRVVT